MIEPNADIRSMAATMMQMFIAFQQAGFTNEQAFDMVKTMLITGINQSGSHN